jgi:hypothetical protein
MGAVTLFSIVLGCPQSQAIKLFPKPTSLCTYTKGNHRVGMPKKSPPKYPQWNH